MKCPNCGKELQVGSMKVSDGSLFCTNVSLTWSSNEKKSFFNKHIVELSLSATGYYCDECMRVYGIFKEK